MTKRMFLFLALTALPVNAFFAPDITGTWQGTLPLKPKELRIVIKVTKADGGALKGALYSIDQGSPAIATTITLAGVTVKMAMPGINGTYEGTLDTDAVNLTGTFTQGGAPLALNLKHVTGDAAWEIPEPAAKLKPMAADADPVFEVAVIKPSQPGMQGKGFAVPGPRQFRTINTNVRDMIWYAYGFHAKQITGGPAWMETDAFDITAKSAGEGQPSQSQYKVMLQKLLADRFQLTFHKEKKELAVYAIVLGKTGPKLTKSEGDPNAPPALMFTGLGTLPARNASMSDFAGVMQGAVMDKPVVDQTGLTGKFDFVLKWTPDETQFAAMGVKIPVPSDDPAAPPDLYNAFQDQLGLKLVATKATVDVMVVDKLAKPSEN